MRILMWDVHGGYTDSLVAGSHEYLFLRSDESGRGGLTRYGSSAPSNKDWRRSSSVSSTSVADQGMICRQSFSSTTLPRPMCR